MCGFERLGILGKRPPYRVCHWTVGKNRRYYAPKLPILVEADRGVFVDVDPEHVLQRSSASVPLDNFAKEGIRPCSTLTAE